MRASLVISMLFFLSMLRGQQEIIVLTYNLENLFDAEVDSSKGYKEFNPGGKKNWNSFRLRDKINGIAKTIAACHDSMPHFIGLEEVENRAVLEQLSHHPLLASYSFEIMHFDSPDHRGIDVGFLYQKEKFSLLNTRAFPALFSDRTRDQLWVRGVFTPTNDTLNFFVNHWPSRYGGKRASEKNRIAAGHQLKTEMDSILTVHPQEHAIAMGDFNDNPKDSSIRILSKSQQYWNCFQDSSFEIGTLKYKRNWEYYDQFILSSNLKDNLSLEFKSVCIFESEHLLEEDETHGGWKPYRTYQGPVYHGGISDHLPVVLVLKQIKK